MIEIMTKACTLKLNQNPELEKFLLDTEGLLAEASPDIFWGTGIGINREYASVMTEWSGKNHLGNILTKLSNDLTK